MKFSFAGGIYLGALFALATFCALLNVPGFAPVTNFLNQIYGFYGYSVSRAGILVGAFWGFIEGFVHLGLFAWIYNKLTK